MVVDAIWTALTADPTLTVIVGSLLLLVFGGYFFLRRILIGAKRGFEAGKRDP